MEKIKNVYNKKKNEFELEYQNFCYFIYNEIKIAFC